MNRVYNILHLTQPNIQYCTYKYSSTFTCSHIKKDIQSIVINSPTCMGDSCVHHNINFILLFFRAEYILSFHVFQCELFARTEQNKLQYILLQLKHMRSEKPKHKKFYVEIVHASQSCRLRFILLHAGCHREVYIMIQYECFWIKVNISTQHQIIIYLADA